MLILPLTHKSTTHLGDPCQKVFFWKDYSRVLPSSMIIFPNLVLFLPPFILQMEAVSLPAVSRVAVCGGTHGNELSGVYLVRELQKKKGERTDNFSLMMVMSNPRAVEHGRRYVEKDLNRCFTTAILRSDTVSLQILQVLTCYAQNGTVLYSDVRQRCPKLRDE